MRGEGDISRKLGAFSHAADVFALVYVFTADSMYEIEMLGLLQLRVILIQREGTDS